MSGQGPTHNEKDINLQEAIMRYIHSIGDLDTLSEKEVDLIFSKIGNVINEDQLLLPI